MVRSHWANSAKAIFPLKGCSYASCAAILSRPAHLTAIKLENVIEPPDIPDASVLSPSYYLSF
jgi:hypothetical protein